MKLQQYYEIKFILWGIFCYLCFTHGNAVGGYATFIMFFHSAVLAFLLHNK